MGLNPDEFGELFKKAEFNLIYRSTSKDFQQLISLEEFMSLGLDYNENVDYYELGFQNYFQKLHNYIWLDDRKHKAIYVSFDEDNQIQGLYLKPYTTYPDSDNRFTKNAYRMPISGEWFVFWGGTNEFINYHYEYEAQRYAYDLVKIQEDATHKNTTLRNESFYAFGEDVVAPADGKIVYVLDGLIDNVPGEMDPENAAGNYVVMEHEHQEYSLLAHLKRHSIKVKVGERVSEGQLIGQCGNSGNSSEPHIHFQVMDHPKMEQAISLRIRFKDGNEPIQGDFIRPLVYNDKTEDKFDKIDNTLTIGDLLLTIPRLIAQFFK